MWNRTENQITLAVIRHGATTANEQRRYLGKTEESLSKGGREFLLSGKEEKRYPSVDYLFCSPMRRCRETAEILYPKVCPIVIPEWEEMDFGQFENRNYEELKEDARYQAWIDSGGTLAFPGGECRVDFIRRCESGFLRMCGALRQEAAKETGKSVSAGLIVHGGTIMALFGSHGDQTYFDYPAPNGGGYFCTMHGWGEHARLKEVTKI